METKKIAIYKNGERHIIEMSVEEYADLLLSYKTNTRSSKVQKPEEEIISINIKECCFKVFVKCIKFKVQQWKDWMYKLLP